MPLEFNSATMTSSESTVRPDKSAVVGRNWRRSSGCTIQLFCLLVAVHVLGSAGVVKRTAAAQSDSVDGRRQSPGSERLLAMAKDPRSRYRQSGQQHQPQQQPASPFELPSPVELDDSDQVQTGLRGGRESKLTGADVVQADAPSRYVRTRSPPPVSGRLTAAAADADRTELVRCGQVDVDPRGALCCDGLVYRRSPGADARCCGRVAYDGEYFACCGRPGRLVIVRRVEDMPACCADRPTEDCPTGTPAREDYTDATFSSAASRGDDACLCRLPSPRPTVDDVTTTKGHCGPRPFPHGLRRLCPDAA
jgi:hypothetical protein